MIGIVVGSSRNAVRKQQWKTLGKHRLPWIVVGEKETQFQSFPKLVR
jgi:hypothetical protein